MPWTEVSPGRWERPLDISEAFFWHLNAGPKPPTRERWTMMGVATFESDLSSDEFIKLLRPAWKAMRHRHPLIAASLEKDKKVYVSPTEAELEEWLDKTITVESETMDIDTLMGNYKSTPWTMLHYLPGSSELMYRSSHWRSDGVGLSVFANHLFDALANPREVVFGDEGKRLPPSLEEAAPTTEITPEKREKVKQKWLGVVKSGQSLGLPFKLSGPPAGTHRKTYLFTEGMTRKIVTAAKSMNLSVTSAVAAALVDVVRKRHPTEESKKPTKYITFPWVNLRPFLPNTFDTEKDPFTVMVINDCLVVDVKDFVSNAKQFGTFYAGNHSGGGAEILSHASAWQELNLSFLIPAPPPPSKPAGAEKEAQKEAPKPAATQPAGPLIMTPALNSLGVFEWYLKPSHKGKHNFEITNFWFSAEILGPNVLAYAWTFRGRMRLTMYYNESFYDAEYVQELMDALMDSLLNNIGLSWDSEAKL